MEKAGKDLSLDDHL